MTIEEQLLRPDIGGLVELFQIDMTPISATAPTIYLTPTTEGAPPAEIARGGQSFVACPIAAEGFERGGSGPLPSPALTIANVGHMVSAWVEGAQDLLGAIVTRTVVLADWLDGGSAADATAAISSDVYEIAQKTSQTPTAVSFSLRSPLESGRQVPFRKAWPKCAHSYRFYNLSTSVWVYGTCPYVAGPMWTVFNISTGSNAADFCPKTTEACSLRFTSGPLPFFGFPSLGRV
jgi:lambda family phage minor tail protein L